MYVIFGEILSNCEQILPKLSNFRSNLANVGLTTNDRLAGVALALDACYGVVRGPRLCQISESYGRSL